MSIAVNIFVLIVIFAGIVALQIFLSKKENKWPGLTLPAIFVFFSLMAVLGITLYGNGKIGQNVLRILFIFVTLNIPPLILLAIYFACREKRKKNKEIEIMSIQDLD